MDNEERFKPEWRDFEKRFRDQLSENLEQIKDLPPENRAKTEDILRERFRREEKETAELEAKEPDFYNPSTQGKHMSLVEFLHFDADRIVEGAFAAQYGKQNPEFEQWWRGQARDMIEKLRGFPADVRSQTEDQIRLRFFKFENDRAALVEKEPNINNPSTQSKHTIRLQRLNAELDYIDKNLGGQPRAKDPAVDVKARTAERTTDDQTGREANEGGPYNPNNYEWRFYNSIKDHREKLDALSPEQRREFENHWREKFTANEQRFKDYLNDGDKFSFEGLEALLDKDQADCKEHVDAACGKARAEKLRDDLKAKTGQAKPHDRDRER